MASTKTRILHRKAALAEYVEEHGLRTVPGFKVDVPKMGKPAREQLAIAQEHMGLAGTGNFNLKTLNRLKPYAPVRRGTGRQVMLAAGHFAGYNAFPGGSEGAAMIALTKRVAWQLRRWGVKVDVCPHAYDLGAEIAWVRANCRDRQAWLLELHSNAGPAAAHGALTAYSPTSWGSKSRARKLTKGIVEATDITAWGSGIIASTTIGAWNGWSDIGWHRSLNGVGIPNLIEVGFHTNAGDRAWLLESKKRNRLARGISNAIAPAKRLSLW